MKSLPTFVRISKIARLQILNLSAPRVSQLVTQVTQKLRKAGQRLGLAE